MNWKLAIQLSAAAIVGAGIFEAGRVVALREYLRTDYEQYAPADDGPLPGPARIRDVQPSFAKKSSAGGAVEKTVPGKRKKYADPPLIPRDQEMIATAERITSQNDLVGARALAQVAAKSSRREVREAAVAMLAWFGKKAIAELTPFLSDKDEDVAMEASAHWRRIFANECDDTEKLSIAALVLNRVRSSEMLDDLGIEDMFNAVDEKAAVETIISVIKEGNSPGVKVAKSAYSTVTGKKWKGEETARHWMETQAADVN